MEGGGDRILADVDLNTFTVENVVEVIEVKARDVPFEKSFALKELAFDALGMAARGKSLAMTVFLMTRRARCRTGGAAGVFGVALGTGKGERETG